MLPLFSVFPTVGLNFVLIAFVIVVLGGMGSIEGALLGRLLRRRGAIGEFILCRPRVPGSCSSSLLFLLVMIFRPNGLFGQKGAATLGMNE